MGNLKGFSNWEIEKMQSEMLVEYPEISIGLNTHILSAHPLIRHKIDVLRSIETPSSEFRSLVEEITMLECYEAMRNLRAEEYLVETPICKTVGRRISGKKLVLAPIMRAGMGMEPGAKKVVPQSRTGHIGLYRDEVTLDPVEYFWKMPKEVESRDIFVLDPMLATGGSAVAAVNKLKNVGCDSIHFMCIIAAPQGIDVMQRKHPDVDLYIGALDLGLNDKGYIVPGLGDAGDRIFGTK